MSDMDLSYFLEKVSSQGKDPIIILFGTQQFFP
jgi:hypothetical protein